MGSLYLSPMIYGFLLTLASDAFRAVNGVVAITHNPPPYSIGVRMSCLAFIFATSVIITLAGAWNANTPVVIERYVTWGNNIGGAYYGSPLKIAALSDIHLGQFTGPKYLKKIVSMTNSHDPDIVLILGDTIDDENFFKDPVRSQEAAELLSSFQSRLGTWAVMGNHDYFAGEDEFVDFLSGTNVNLLKDEAAFPGGELILAGRDDRTVMRYGRERRSIDDIVNNITPWISAETQIPLIVMDHQPSDLEESEKSGVTLQISGHTHRGQLFPFNFLVSRMYERHYGLYKKVGTNYYISSGVGTWGPPVRTIGRPEIVILNLINAAKTRTSDYR
jgi:predicted MPP superfamily phosphohydrolase